MVKTMPDRIASGATYCLSGGLICNGLYTFFDWVHRLDWNFIGLVSGALLGVATFVVNTFYKRRDDARREAARQDEAEQQRIRTAALESYLKRSPRHDEARAPEVVATVNEALKIAEKP